MLYDMDADTQDFAVSFADRMRKSMIKSMFDKNYKAKLEEWYDLWSKYMDDGVIDNEEQSALDNLKNSIVNGAKAGADLINDQFKDIYQEEARREASKSNGITASQDSVDETNGRLTVIQSHTYSMTESLKTLVLIANLMLEKLIGIENNTNRLEKIESHLLSVKNGIGVIATTGVKVKKKG